MDDTILAKKAQSGGRRAFDLLVDRYYRMVYGICFSMTENAVDADELAHDSFVTAYLKLGQLKDPERIGGWLKTITLNVCRMWLREKKKQNTVPLDDSIIAREESAPDYARMYFGISQLSPVYRMVLALYYFEGLSYSEIARFLDIPYGTVMSRLNRARNLLREEMLEMTDDTGYAPDMKFKEEVQAEVKLLLSMNECRADVGTRLRALFEKSPDRLIRLLTDDPELLHNIAVIMPRLGNNAIESILTASMSSTDLAEYAKAVLSGYVARCAPISLAGAPDMAAIDAYVLTDQMRGLDAESSSAMLYFFAESCKDPATRALFVSALCCYPEAFDLLMANFTEGGSSWVRHALVRYGNRFLKEVYALLESDPQRGLAGLSTIAKSIVDDISPLKYANERRMADRYPPVLRDELDSELLRACTARAAELVGSADAETRNHALGVLSSLEACEYLTVVLASLQHPDLSTRLAAIRVLAGLGGGTQEIFSIAQNGTGQERVVAVEALGQIGVVESVPMLMDLAIGDDRALRDAAITALGGIDSPDAETVLRELLTCKDAGKLAAKALYGGNKRKERKLSEVEQRLAEIRKRRSEPIAEISLDAAIRYALPELRAYQEAELTERISCVCEDYCATRRYLIEYRLMARSGGIYTFTSLGESVWRVEHSIMEGECR